MTNLASHPESRGRLRQLVAARLVQAAAVLILTGAVFKLFWGAPNDLPEPVFRAIAHMPTAGFAAVVAIELLVGMLALLSPKLGWGPLAGLLGVFCLITIQQVADGDEACGCFGSLISAPPALMLLIDGALLSGLILLMPWSALADTPLRFWALPAAAVATIAGAGILILETAQPGEPTLPDPLRIASDDTDPVRSNSNRAAAEPGSPGTNGASRTMARETDSGREQAIRLDPDEWRMPTEFPRFVILRPSTWIGKRIDYTNLATWVNTARFPDDARIIFYMDTCPHCAKHLRTLAQDPGDDQYVLIELPLVRFDLPRVVDTLPDAMHFALTDRTRWALKVPWDVRIVDRVVIEAKYRGH